MKRFLELMGLALAVCALGCAQDTTGDRIVVPARNTSHPRVVNCTVLNGSITVKTYGGKEVIVEGAGAAARHQRTGSNGMRRIDMSPRGLEVVEEDNVITVRNRLNGNEGLVITVPVDTSVRLRSLSGQINVNGIHGEADVHTLNGHIKLTDISGTVTADSQNGEIKVTMDSVDQSKPLALSTFNGVVDVTFPPDFKANLTVKTNHAAVFSDFEVTLGGTRAVSEKSGSPDGTFRIRIDNTIRGTINGGGTDLAIHTFNGSVYIRKKK